MLNLSRGEKKKKATDWLVGCGPFPAGTRVPKQATLNHWEKSPNRVKWHVSKEIIRFLKAGFSVTKNTLERSSN